MDVHLIKQKKFSSSVPIITMCQLTVVSANGSDNNNNNNNNNNMENVEDLKRRSEELEKELKEVNEQISKLGGSTTTASLLLAPPGKSGYLFKWQDRSIGFTGTKWALRFVKLDRGRISYYLSHLENSPRYVLSLRGCAVSDEGWKRNRRHRPNFLTTQAGKDPPLEEVGAYFFVFSIYHRQDSAATESEESNEVIPLLRFSTPSLAEKTQWIELLSEACAYCETDKFLMEESNRNAEEETRRQQQIAMSQAMPTAERGTLPPLYFAPDITNKRALVRRPSLSKLPSKGLFRTKSQTNDAEKTEKKGFPPSKPMHRGSAPSFLSAEASSQNYRGFFNLAMVILIVSNFRLVLNSVRQHGFQMWDLSNLSGLSFATWTQYPFLTGMLMLQVFIVLAFVIEKCLAYKQLYNPVGMVLHQINAHTSFAVSIYIVWNLIDSPAVGGCLMLNAAITWMKLLSYALANEDYRIRAKTKDAEATLAAIDNIDSEDWNIEYPRNVTFWNIYYFWLAPTLTYQIAFPKTPRVRPLRVVGIVVRLVMVFSLFTFLIVQTVAPVLKNLLADLDATNGAYTYSILAEYWLRLSITNTYLWLIVFYFYFHLWFNLFAELLRFGDRVFYRDWWNSSEVSAYWRLWNLPVHYWLVRHLYFPCVRNGLPKGVATFSVFFFSAVMHEVMISIPFQMLRPWSFLGMMGQVPLIVITKWLYRKFPGSSVGNILFWVSFCVIGQPMAILLYTIDYKYSKMHDGSAAVSLGELQTCRFEFRDTCVLR